MHWTNLSSAGFASFNHGYRMTKQVSEVLIAMALSKESRQEWMERTGGCSHD